MILFICCDKVSFFSSIVTQALTQLFYVVTPLSSPTGHHWSCPPRTCPHFTPFANMGFPLITNTQHLCLSPRPGNYQNLNWPLPNSVFTSPCRPSSSQQEVHLSSISGQFISTLVRQEQRAPVQFSVGFSNKIVYIKKLIKIIRSVSCFLHPSVIIS